MLFLEAGGLSLANHIMILGYRLLQKNTCSGMEHSLRRSQCASISAIIILKAFSPLKVKHTVLNLPNHTRIMLEQITFQLHLHS